VNDSHDDKIKGKDELAYAPLFTSNYATFKMFFDFWKSVSFKPHQNSVSTSQ